MSGEGEMKRDEAIERVINAASPEWKLAARAAVASLAQGGEEFTTDDVWSRLEAERQRVVEPRAMGGVIQSMLRQHIIRKVGNQPSERDTCHARPISIYVGSKRIRSKRKVAA